MSTKTKPLNDPKSQILKRLLAWDHLDILADGKFWRQEIEKALEATSELQLEFDNFRLQGELNVAMSVIAEQELNIKRQEMLIGEYRDQRKIINHKLDEVLQLRVGNDYMGY